MYWSEHVQYILWHSTHMLLVSFIIIFLFTWHFSLSAASKRANSRALTTPVLLNTENVRVLLNQIPFSKTTNIYCKCLQHCFKKSKVASLMYFQDAFFPTVDVHPILGFQENYL